MLEIWKSLEIYIIANEPHNRARLVTLNKFCRLIKISLVINGYKNAFELFSRSNVTDIRIFYSKVGTFVISYLFSS